MRRPEGERRLDLAPNRRLLVGRHHVVTGVDLARVLLDRQVGLRFLVAEDPALALGHHLLAVGPRADAVAPVAKRPLGELHDVALVHEGDAAATLGESVFDRRSHQSLGPLARHRLDADAARLGEADLLHAHLALQEVDDLLRLGTLGRPLDSGVNVLGVLAEDDHVDRLGMLHRARDADEPAHRAQADVEVEELAQRHVERADAPTDRRRERPLDADEELPEGGDGFLREPVPEAIERLLARVDLAPGDTALAAVGLGDRRVEREARRLPDVGAGAVALDEGDDRPVGHHQPAVAAHADRLPVGRHFHDLVGRHSLPRFPFPNAVRRGRLGDTRCASRRAAFAPSSDRPGASLAGAHRHRRIRGPLV